INRVQIHGSPRCHSTPRPRPSRSLPSWRVGFPPPSPRPGSQRESAPDRVWDVYLVIQPGTRHAVAPESLHQTQAGPDSRPMGPGAAQIVSCVRDFLGSSAIRGQSMGSKGRSSCDAGAMATAPDYGDFALKRFLGLDIEQVASGRARAQITIADEHRNPNGVVHGAVYFAMVDTAMGAATMSLLSDGRFCTSVEVQLRFIRPAANGVLIADVSVVKMGRSVVHLEARVHDGDERLIATGGGTFAIVES